MTYSSPNEHPQKPLAHQLNRVFGEINAVLVAVALGLAVLNASCFVALKTSEAIATARLRLATNGSVMVWPDDERLR